MADIRDCFDCKYYDSSVDACNCDDKCYVDGARDFAEWVYGKNFVFGARTKQSRINELITMWKEGRQK